MTIKPYINFPGTTAQAIDFYKNAFGATVKMLQRFKDVPPGQFPIKEEQKELIMHAALDIEGNEILMSDGMDQTATGNSNFSLSLLFTDEEKAIRVFNAVSEGGTVTMPPQKTYWAKLFGMCKDKFGIDWMINVD